MQAMLLCYKTESNERTEANPWPATLREMCADNAFPTAVSSFKLVTFSSATSNSQILDYILKGSPYLQHLKILSRKESLLALKYLLCRSRSWRQQPEPCGQGRFTQRKPFTTVSSIYTRELRQRKYSLRRGNFYLLSAMLSFRLNRIVQICVQRGKEKCSQYQLNRIN